MALIVKSKIKEYISLNVGEDLMRALEMEIEDIL